MKLNFILHFKFSPVTCLERKTKYHFFSRNVYKGPNNEKNLFLSPTQIAGNVKNQYFRLFTYPKIVQEDHFERHSPATDYVQDKKISEKINNMNKIFFETSTQVEIYNSSMITPEALEKIIVIHEKQKQSKKDQEDKQTQIKKDQEDKQNQIKKDQMNHTDNNDEIPHT